VDDFITTPPKRSVISARVGAAIAVVLSIAALALAVVAFMSTVRDDSTHPGRFVQTRLTNQYTGEPVLFPLDDFYVGRDSNFHIRALYVYPPGYYGHDRGCKVVWDSTATMDTEKGRVGPGLYLEPCGGSHFDRDGILVSGPADRGLDYFATQPGVDGVLVDTRRLICGPDYIPPTPAPATATALAATATVVALTETPEVPSETPEGTPRPRTCERVSPNGK
jgi:hypothetical protein